MLNFGDADGDICPVCRSLVGEAEQLAGLIRSALSSMEMRTENGRGFDLQVPLPWIEAAHKLLYEDNADAVLSDRINHARERMRRRNAR